MSEFTLPLEASLRTILEVVHESGVGSPKVQRDLIQALALGEAKVEMQHTEDGCLALVLKPIPVSG